MMRVSSSDEDEYVSAMRGQVKEMVILPTIGGKLIEPLSSDYLLRYLRVRKFNVNGAVRLYANQINFRVLRFGMRPLEEKVPHLLRIIDPIENDNKPIRILLDLEKLFLDSSSSKDNNNVTLQYTESIWFVMDKALKSKDAQVHGFILIIDARSISAPFYNLRPNRLKEFIGSIIIPARLVSILVVGGSRWLYIAWLLALRPFVKSKILKRASHLSLDQAASLLPDIQLQLPLKESIVQSIIRAQTLTSRTARHGPTSPHRIFPTEDSPNDEPEQEYFFSPDEDKSFTTDRKNPIAISTPSVSVSEITKKKNVLLPKPPASTEGENAVATPVLPPTAPPPEIVLSRERIIAIQEECDAQSIDLPDGIQFWDEDSIYVYFATEGVVIPTTQPPKRRTSRSNHSDYRQLYF